MESPWPEAVPLGAGPGSASISRPASGCASDAPATGARSRWSERAGGRRQRGRAPGAGGDAGAVRLPSAPGRRRQAAIDAFARQPYRLAILDAAMPDMAGLTAAETIRADADPALRIILLSTAGSSGARPGAAFDPSNETRQGRDLVRAIASVYPRTPLRRGAKTQPRRQGPRLRILVCEDNAVNQKLARRVLEIEGTRCKWRGDGQEGLRLLASYEFDLILMDVRCPTWTGWRPRPPIRAMERARGDGRRIPILAMTAHAMKGDREPAGCPAMDGLRWQAGPPRRDLRSHRCLALHPLATRRTITERDRQGADGRIGGHWLTRAVR